MAKLFRIRATRTLLAASACLMASVATAQTTVSFQNGINGYTGSIDKVIASDGIDAGTGLPNPNIERVGSEVQNYFLDGGSPDRNALYQFNSIFGNGANQIPMGATILDAKFSVVTSGEGNARTGGNFFVAGLTSPFTTTTTYNDYAGGLGAWWESGTSTRPVDGVGPTRSGNVSSFDVTSLVQDWSSGNLANNGLVIQAGHGGHTTDGWSVNSTSFSDSTRRPKLEITYTTAAEAEVNVFQEGVNGYTGNSMVLVDSGSIAAPSPSIDANPVIIDPINGDQPDDVSYDGSTITAGGFLDGPALSPYDSNGNLNPIGTVGSRDVFGLIKFDNVFGNGAGQAPADVPVGKAYVVLTTHTSSTDSPATDSYKIQPLYRDWNTTDLPLHSEFGDIAGLQQSDGDVGEVLDSMVGVVTGTEVWFDVTSYLEAARAGNPLGGADYGLAVTSNTTDGWQIAFNGDTDLTIRPRLVVVSAPSSIIEPGLSGDFNDDGIVDLGDYTLWRDNLGSSNSLNGNGNENGASAGIVDMADYDLWKTNFGNTSGVSPALASVPEPSALALVALALGAVAFRRVR
ncbi:DNRLRE domain-containing protein [Aeoliella mucimassa]|uniref:Ice-binding protein C-terminal domain-containing protein n=1 Tax=Aeoliella mucimassa TaxID=2527972 RepID=A0A518AIK4_9BACT|nr:DNRLRE domain-containing protein [Aeoliella mucimassa]QDU54494.1 hypothetical protein Pan181_06760 [Aeoliella mucimassa]